MSASLSPEGVAYLREQAENARAIARIVPSDALKGKFEEIGRGYETVVRGWIEDGALNEELWAHASGLLIWAVAELRESCPGESPQQIGHA